MWSFQVNHTVDGHSISAKSSRHFLAAAVLILWFSWFSMMFLSLSCRSCVADVWCEYKEHVYHQTNMEVRGKLPRHWFSLSIMGSRDQTLRGWCFYLLSHLGFLELDNFNLFLMFGEHSLWVLHGGVSWCTSHIYLQTVCSSAISVNIKMINTFRYFPYLCLVLSLAKRAVLRFYCSFLSLVFSFLYF